MRIGIDARPLTKNRAGIGTYVYSVVKALNAMEDNNEYYLFSCKDIVLDFELKSNWHIVVDEFRVGTLWLSFKGASLIKKYNIDTFWGTQHVLPVRKNKGVRYVLTICDLAQFRIKNIGSTYNTIIQKVFVKGSCRRADEILAISEATKKDIIELFGIESFKIKCIYLGGVEKGETVSSKCIDDTMSKYKVPEKYFLFVSTIEPRKNVDTLVKAFDKFKSTDRDGYALVLAGGLGWKYESVTKAIEESSYKASVIMTGFVSREEKAALFANAQAFVYPSLYEGFGIPILEAMNYQIPIVTTNISSLPEVGGDAVMYLDDVRNADELQKLLLKCSRLSEEERNSIALKEQTQREKFSWEKCAVQTCAELVK